MPYFDLCAGWLRYRPYRKYEIQIPNLVLVYNEEGRRIKGPFTSQKGKHLFARPLWKLHWPGQVSKKKEPQDQIPAPILKNILGDIEPPSYSLYDILQISPLPKELPETIAYHLAVNKDYYYPDKPGTQHPVAGLPEPTVDQVLEATYAPDFHARKALKYLKWVAETHRPHPMLEGFDTNIRDKLLGISVEAIHLYFFLLSDYLYDPQKEYWSRNKKLYCQTANYLNWVGQTGQGLYTKYSRLEETEESVKIFERIQKWQELDCNRGLSHESGKALFDDDSGQPLV